MKKLLVSMLAVGVLAGAVVPSNALTLSYRVDAGAGFTNTVNVPFAASNLVVTPDSGNFISAGGADVNLAHYVLQTNNVSEPGDSMTYNFAGGAGYVMRVFANGNPADFVDFIINGTIAISNVHGPNLPSIGASASSSLTLFSPMMTNGMTAITNTPVYFNFESFDKLDAPANPLGVPYAFTSAPQTGSITVHIFATPEPGTVGMMAGMGLGGGLFLFRLRRRRTA